LENSIPISLGITMRIVHSALYISLAPWARVGVRGTLMGPAAVIDMGGAGAITVRAEAHPHR
jgi:hypothetical protein